MDNQANNERLELFVNELNSCIADNAFGNTRSVCGNHNEHPANIQRTDKTEQIWTLKKS